jgi:hypothetical protein
MNAIVPRAKYVLVPIAEIDVPTSLLAYHATTTVQLAKAIRAGVEIEPLSVVKNHGRYVLVEGKDEFAALKLVGAEMAPVRFAVDIPLTWRQRRLLGRKAQ